MTHASIDKPRHEASAEDLAFARSRRKAATKEAKHVEPVETHADEPEAVEERPATSEMAALKAEMNELRAMLRQAMASNKGQTSARAQGAVADAEYAAEEANAALAALRTKFDTAANAWTLNDGVTAEQADKAKELCDKLRIDVDVARCLAGIIPQDHPGLRRLPPEHPVFRKR